MRSVVPVASITPTSATHASFCPRYYVIDAARALPVIDCTVSVKQVVFSSPWLRRFNRFAFVARPWLGPAYWTGFPLCAAVLFTSTTIATWFAVVSAPLQLVPMLVALLVLRYDMVVLLFQTYEFWYMTLMNGFVCVGIALSFGDVRWVIVLATGVGFELALLIDANFRRTRAIVLGTAFGALLNIGYVACTTFGFVPTAKNPTLVAFNGRTLQLDDAILNVLSTVFIILLRNAYRKHVTTTSSKRSVECVTYRCRLRIRPVAATHVRVEPPQSHLPIAGNISELAFGNDPRRESGMATSRALGLASAAQLRFVHDPQTLDATDVVGRAIIQRYHSASTALPCILMLCSITSLVSIVVTILSSDARLATVVAPLSVVTALVVFVAYVASAQRTLLHRLLTSFDFLFLSVQITATHLCLADIVQWRDPRALAVLASWLLTHWVLLLDAVLPVHKLRRLGYRSTIACAVVVMLLVGQLLAVVVLIVADDLNTPRLRLRDRELFTVTIHRRTKVVCVVPLLFGRTLATLSWSLRLLWRLWDGRIDELLLLQGRVGFHTQPPTERPLAQRRAPK